jgi:hypothetical protein
MTPKEDQQPMTTRDELVACRKQRMDQIDYSVDLQRIIEDLCRNRPIREPQTGARHHYEMAVAYRLASRQEVSVEELASIYGQTLATGLLAEYSMMRRTKEG